MGSVILPAPAAATPTSPESAALSTSAPVIVPCVVPRLGAAAVITPAAGREAGRSATLRSAATGSGGRRIGLLTAFGAFHAIGHPAVGLAQGGTEHEEGDEESRRHQRQQERILRRRLAGLQTAHRRAGPVHCTSGTVPNPRGREGAASRSSRRCRKVRKP